MKIYEPETQELVRAQIVKQGSKTEYITLCETTIEEFLAVVKNILEGKILKFPEGKRTHINARRAKGSKNLNSKSISFYGLDTAEVKEIILKHLQK